MYQQKNQAGVQGDIIKKCIFSGLVNGLLSVLGVFS